MLDLIRNCINHVPEAAALFYDELANVIEKRQLDPKTEVIFVAYGNRYDGIDSDGDDGDGDGSNGDGGDDGDDGDGSGENGDDGDDSVGSNYGGCGRHNDNDGVFISLFQHISCFFRLGSVRRLLEISKMTFW